MASTQTAEPDELRRALSDRMIEMANELIAPMLCTQPAGGLGPGTHCAACCYGTGIIITCAEDQAIADAAAALHKAACAVYNPKPNEPENSDG